MMTLDSQQIEALGEAQLITSLIRQGYEVAKPRRDHGIDLLAYKIEISPPIYIPIQMKAASEKSFSIYRKYERFTGLHMAYVWHVMDYHPEIYIMTYDDAVQIADTMGYTNTVSWIEHGHYASTRPSKKLLSLMQPFKITPD